MNIEDLKVAVKNSNSYNGVLIYLKSNKSGGNYKKVKKLIFENNIDISHFLTRDEICKRANQFVEKSLDEVLVKNSTFNSGNTLKIKLYKAGLKQPICEECGQGEIWRGNKISMILDHIDGDHYNNEITNLRILCPNCNAATPTFAGKNRTSFKLKEKRKQVELRFKKDKLEEIKNKLLEAKIDFSKKTWGIKVAQELNTSPAWALKYIKKNFPELIIMPS